MKAILFLAFLALSGVLAGCSRHAPPSPQNIGQQPYTEDDVRKSVLPGTPRESIVGRFGQPMVDEKNPRFEDGSTNIDEILVFTLPSTNPPKNENWVFAGFQVRLKDGKAVEWSVVHMDTHARP
jgi:hypothetical protein